MDYLNDCENEYLNQNRLQTYFDKKLVLQEKGKVLNIKTEFRKYQWIWPKLKANHHGKRKIEIITYQSIKKKRK